MTTLQQLAVLNEEIISCRKCLQLARYRERIARTKRRAYRDWTYWGRPVPSFGDPQAEPLIIGLAPAAHGANRTGRMFTGDRSGDEFSHGVSYQLSSVLSRQSSKAQPGYAEATGAGQLQTRLPRLFASYHPSQQNTQTGRLTPAMFLRVLRQIRRFLSA